MTMDGTQLFKSANTYVEITDGRIEVGSSGCNSLGHTVRGVKFFEGIVFSESLDQAVHESVTRSQNRVFKQYANNTVKKNPTALYSLRKVFSSYIGAALQVIMASSLHGVDLILDEQGVIQSIFYLSATSTDRQYIEQLFSNPAETFTVLTWWDQSGNGKHLMSDANNAAARPRLVFKNP